MKHLSIALPSRKTLGKMRRGEKVLIKQGEGMNLIIHPSRYNLITKTFMRGKGVHIVLTPEEREHNDMSESDSDKESESDSDKEEGKGLYATGGGLYASGGHPPPSRAIATIGAKRWNEPPNRNLQDATMGKNGADNMSALMIHHSTQALHNIPLSHPSMGMGLTAGMGLSAGMGLRHHKYRHEKGSVGIHGSLLMGGRLPPALTSQPYSSNFQFGHTLPPAYQHFAKSGSGY